MSSKVAAWICCWGVLSVVGGCGKAEGGAEPIPLSELPTRVANLLCDSLAGCCKTSGIPMNVAACKTFYTVGLQEDYGEVDLQRLRYDPDAAGACLSAISAKIECGRVDRDEPPECDRIFTGRIALDQPCMSTQDCADVPGRSVFCDGQGSSSRRVCVGGSNATPAQGVALGEPCSASDACSGTAFCNSITGLCTAPQPDGSPCESNQQCLSDSCTAAPEAMAEPGLAPRACSSAAAATAAWCGRDFASSPTDDTSADPGTDPGTDPGDP